MTPEEQTMLSDLVDRVTQTRLTEKDPEAEQLLNQQLGRNPDALYILAQTVLVQKYALEQSQAQLRQLQQTQQQQPARTTSFLGNLLGHHDSVPQPPPPPPPPQPGYGTAPYAQPWTQVPSYGPPPPLPGGGSSFLRTAATTAAGVAAGALAFQGIESLMHGFGGQPSGLAGGGYFGGEGRPEETVINNYYDDAGNQRDRVADSSLVNGGNDAQDLQQASEGLRDDGNIGDDDSNLDDSSLDDSSYDDSSFDDSSGGDDLA
jgi:uncharacterized protein